MKKIILISGSLSQKSLSASLIHESIKILKKHKYSTELIDLRSEDMPFCDGRKLEEYPARIREIYSLIQESDALIFGMPVYCYSVSGPLKNFIDIFSQAFEKIPFGVCSAAGTKLSYLATADLMKILSYESKCVMVQPTVMADGKDFDKGVLVSKEVIKKIEDMIHVLTKIEL